MTRRGILTGGTWCVDRNIMVDSWPEENGRADILEHFQCGGGSGYNMAVDIKKLDPQMPVATVTLVGADADGAFLMAEAEAHGIDHARMMTTAEGQTDYTFAFASRDKGQRTHVSFFGSAHLLSPDHFDFRNYNHRIFHLGLPGIHEIMDASWNGYANGWAATLDSARKAGLETNMELASIAPDRLASLIRPCLPYLDLLIVNDHEIGGIAGIDTVSSGQTNLDACIEAASSALAMGTMEVVAVHFPKCAIVVARNGQILLQPSLDVPSSVIKGANGAGDAFAAGFLYGWHQEWPLDETIRLAHATAAASLRDITTTASIEAWQACLELAERWGWRDMHGRDVAPD